MFIRVITEMSGERILNTDKIISIQNDGGNITTILLEGGIGYMMIVSPSYEELATKLIEEQNEKRNFIEYTIDKTLGKLENTIVNAMRYTAMNIELNKVDPVLPSPPSDNESYPDYLKRRLENFLKGGSPHEDND